MMSTAVIAKDGLPKRVLLIETSTRPVSVDEYNAYAGDGVDVIGPLSSLEEARAVFRGMRFDDIVLVGEEGPGRYA